MQLSKSFPSPSMLEFHIPHTSSALTVAKKNPPSFHVPSQGSSLDLETHKKLYYSPEPFYFTTSLYIFRYIYTAECHLDWDLIARMYLARMVFMVGRKKKQESIKKIFLIVDISHNRHIWHFLPLPPFETANSGLPAEKSRGQQKYFTAHFAHIPIAQRLLFAETQLSLPQHHDKNKKASR